MIYNTRYELNSQYTIRGNNILKLVNVAQTVWHAYNILIIIIISRRTTKRSYYKYELRYYILSYRFIIIRVTIDRKNQFFLFLSSK